MSEFKKGDQFRHTDKYFATYSKVHDFIKADPVLAYECVSYDHVGTYFFLHPSSGCIFSVFIERFEEWLANGLVEPIRKPPDYMAIIRDLCA